eukprot:1294892-Karenia_brevis.AAC.1
MNKESIFQYLSNLQDFLPEDLIVKLDTSILVMDEVRTVADTGIEPNSVLHLVLRLRGGMGKKGVKKVITKQEKMAALRATTLYRAQSSAGIDHILAPLNAPNFIPTKIDTMSDENVVALNTAVNEINQVREQCFFETITPFFVPEVAQWQQQIEELENRISTVQSAVSTVFCDSYYGTSGYNYQTFFDAVQNRVNAVEAQRLRAQIQAETRAEMQAAAMDADM